MSLGMQAKLLRVLADGTHPAARLVASSAP